MTKTQDQTRADDPFETWRQLYDANERAWTEALEQTMSSPEFEESSGKMLETMLAAQKSVRDNMRTYLETMNVPTREDIARLGELVVGLEEKIDQVVDRLDTIEDCHPGGARGRHRTGWTQRRRRTGRTRRTHWTGWPYRTRRTSWKGRSRRPRRASWAGWPCRPRRNGEACHLVEARGIGKGC